MHTSQKLTEMNYTLKIWCKMPRRKQRKRSLILVLGTTFWIWQQFFCIWHKKHKQQNQKQTDGSIANKKNFCTAIQINKMNKQPTEWEKIVTNHIADKGLIFKMHSELIEQHAYIQIQCKLKWAEDLKTYKWAITTWKEVLHR